ncbi:MAG: rhodanese-like domain-containing protein [Treponema sp.]
MTKKTRNCLTSFLILLFSVQLLFANGGQEAGSIVSLSGENLEKIMNDKNERDKYHIIDVREANEYSEGHVKYAINISVREIENRTKEISDWKDKNVVVLCRSGKRSRQAAEILKKQGFSHLFNADGVASYRYTTLTTIPNIRGQQLQTLADAGGHSIVDFRENQDFHASHIKDAVHATVGVLSEATTMLPKDKPVLVYSYSGTHSFSGAEQLAAAGYTVINSIDGTKDYPQFKLVP